MDVLSDWLRVLETRGLLLARSAFRDAALVTRRPAMQGD